MLKYLTLLLLLFTLLHSKEYPILFSKMGSPLYKSIKPISKLSKIKKIEKSSLEYIQEVNETLEYGNKVDNKNKDTNPKEYLLKLRKLQKKYDYVLYLLHKEINQAIDQKNYALFIKLTNYKLDGLLNSRTLLEKAKKFYKENKTNKKSKFLEEKITFEKNLVYSQEFINKTHKSTFNPSKQDKKRAVNLISRIVGDTTIIDIENNNPYSVTIKLTPTYKNIEYNKKISNFVILKPHSKKEYIRLSVKNKALASKYSYKYRWIIGTRGAVHNDNYLYRLPYKIGTSQVVSQGYNGDFTHKGRSKYAIDFAMDVGTALCAARDGVVVKIKSDSDKRGDTKEFAKYGNHVIIEHDDGTLGTYYHLKKDGVLVNISQKVARGQIIGYSGNTGFSRGPHLHFSVSKINNVNKNESIPIKFITKSGIKSNPKKGIFYTAVK